MKNTLKYYYNLDVNNIRQVNNTFYINSDNTNYILCICDLAELNNMQKYLYGNYNFHSLVLTVNKEKVIIYNGKSYALFKINTVFKKIKIDDVIESNTFITGNKKIVSEWIELWTMHIDYIEYQMKEIKSNYNYLDKILYYYIGLAENAIQILKSIEENYIPMYITHKRVKANMDLVELYNPTTLVIDTRVRDCAEYYKDSFFYSDVKESDILNNIEKIISNYNNIEKELFFARMLYPTYFFDAYEKIVMDNENKIIIDDIIFKSNEYEKLLNQIYIIIKKTTYIDNIDWLFT